MCWRYIFRSFPTISKFKVGTLNERDSKYTREDIVAVLTINNDRIVVIFCLEWVVLYAGDTNEARVESGAIHSSFPAGSAHNNLFCF